MIVESWGGEYEMRRSGQRDRCCSEGVHAKQATTVTGGRFAVAIRMLVRGTAIMMVVSCAVGMNMDAAVVIVGAGNAMPLRQAVGRDRAISEGQRQRRRDNTQAIDDGCNHRRPNAQSLGQPSQHVARAFALSRCLPANLRDESGLDKAWQLPGLISLPIGSQSPLKPRRFHLSR
jgi:hypothetical protein